MANRSRRFKLDYNNGTSQETIAELNQDTGALKIDRFVEIRRKNDPDILKVWLEGDNYGQAIPTRKSEFGTAQNGTDEPEILLKQYNQSSDSFDTVNRFFAKNAGSIDENGNLAWKLYSFMKFTARQDLGSDKSDSGDLESALNKVLPKNGYVADVPSGASVPGVDNYRLSSGTRREKGYQELTRNYNFAMTFTANLDSNNDYKVKFEPVGFGGTVQTLIPNSQAGSFQVANVDKANDIFIVNGDQTNILAVNQEIEVIGSSGNDGTYTINSLNYDSTNDETDITVDENVSDSTADGQIIPGGQAIFKTWEKDKTDEVINKVKVEATNSNGATVTGSAKNQDMIDKFGVKFKKFKIPYVESASEADRIAKSYLVPGKDNQGNDITEPPESGIVKTAVFSDNIVNDSMQIVDNTRNIDDTFTVVQQRNFWPEGVSELEFEFEKENLEEAARESENLRDERARLYPDSTTDVGNQNVSADTEDVSDEYDAHQPSAVDHDVNGQSYTETIDDSQSNEGRTTFSGLSVGSTLSLNINTDFVSGNTDKTWLYFQANVTNNSSSTDGWDLRIVNNDTNTEYFNESNWIAGDAVPLNGTVVASTLVIAQEDLEGDQIDFELTNNTDKSEDVQVNAAVCQLTDFTINQPSQTNGTSSDSDGSTNSTNPSDSTAGDTTSLSASGNTDTKNINTTTENKTNR